MTFTLFLVFFRTSVSPAVSLASQVPQSSGKSLTFRDINAALILGLVPAPPSSSWIGRCRGGAPL